LINSMFEQDIELIRRPQMQRTFVMHLYDGLNKCEACAAMRINPAVVGYVRNENADFNAAIRNAEAYRIDMLTDKLANIEDYFDDPIMAGVASKNIQWLASKRMRKIYGDKQDIVVSHVISIKDAITEANNRTRHFIEHNPLENMNALTDNISVEPLKISKAVDFEDDDPLS